jgi:predicted nucleotidyltransferase
MITNHAELHPFLVDAGKPLVFASVTGSQAYGLEGPDSDWDVKGCYAYDWRTVAGITDYVDSQRYQPVPDVDITLLELGRFGGLLRQGNCSALEHLCSPLVITRSYVYEALTRLAPYLISRQTIRSYYGFAASRAKEEPTVKNILMTYRVALSGLYAALEGRIHQYLPALLDEFSPGIRALTGLQDDTPFLNDLIARKKSGLLIATTEEQRYSREVLIPRLLSALREAYEGFRESVELGRIHQHLNRIVLEARSPEGFS